MNKNTKRQRIVLLLLSALAAVVLSRAGASAGEKNAQTEQSAVNTASQNTVSQNILSPAAQLREQIEAQNAAVVYENAVSCYMNLYLYSYEDQYLEAYSEFVSKKKTAYEQLYQLGEATPSDVKECEAQMASCNAEITVLNNEKEYCTSYIEEKAPELGHILIEESRTIHDRAYYMEKNPEQDDMEILRSMTDFRNAQAQIDAEKAEIASLEERLKMKALLYGEGEITELELTEEKVLLEKARYELAKLYVALNTAYYDLEG
ncbi:MAG: TolC family protein [Lachnospiraceae bacterium]|nr:TolC family protein [Lachnospiraceae bacterium]